MANTYSNNSSIVNMKVLLNEYIKHWWWFAIGVVALVGLTFLFTKITYQKFGITSTVLVADDQASMPSAAALMAKSGLDFGGMFGGTASVYNEMALMNSYAVCLKTVKDMGLNVSYTVSNGILKKMPTDPAMSPLRLSCAKSIPDTLSTMILFKVSVGKDGKPKVKTTIGKRSAFTTKSESFPVTIDTDYGQYSIDTTSFFRPGRKLNESILLMSYSNSAELLAEAVKVKQLNKKADIIQVDMSSPNAKYTREIMERLIRYYNATGMEQQYNRTSATFRFLNERIDSISSGLHALEDEIAAYKKSHKMPNFAYNASLDVTRYDKYAELLRAAEVEYKVMNLVKSFISDPSNKYSLIPQVGDSIGGIQASVKAYNEQLLERMNLANNAKANNAAIKLIDEQLAMMRSNIDTSLDRFMDTYSYRLSELRRLTREAESKMTGVPDTELEYGNIERKHAVEEQIYLYLLQQREETSMKMSNIMPRGVVLDAPHILMEPLGLSTTKKLIVAFLMGLLIPATILFALVLRRDTAIQAAK